MKILLTGGGSGGHFYPIIAIADELHKLQKEFKLVDLSLYYMSSQPYNQGILFERNIEFIKTSAGKMRRYSSFLNVIDIFKMGWGIFVSLWKLFKLYPDVVFGKGGYASVPALYAARILGIPVIIHESDCAPGRANQWAGKFAKKIAVSYPEAAAYFDPKKVAVTGQPVREDILIPLTSGAREYLQLEKDVPTLLVLGGSLGAKLINDAILEALPELLTHYQVIHQTGKAHIEEMRAVSDVLLAAHPHKERYKPFDYLNALSLRMAAGASQLVLTRAGSTLFEVAAWGKPSIIIPITDSNEDHQRKNAYAFAAQGASVVIEEKNLKTHILIEEIDRILTQQTIQSSMSEAAHSLYTKEAAKRIAEEILALALTHGKEDKIIDTSSLPGTPEDTRGAENSQEKTSAQNIIFGSLPTLTTRDEVEQEQERIVTAEDSQVE